MAQIDVYINNDIPSPSSVTLGDDDILVFTNNDSTPHLIELWTKNQTCTWIGVLITASGGTLTFAPDPNADNATIYYNVLTPGQTTSPTRGDHGIVVGSGLPGIAEEAAAGSGVAPLAVSRMAEEPAGESSGHGIIVGSGQPTKAGGEAA